MPVSYIQMSNPFWYFPGLTGLAAGGASIYSYESQDKELYKSIYQDAEGLIPWPNPIVLGMDGESTGPFYFANDTPYYLVIYDANGNLLREIDNFTPQSGGGGGDVTENLFVENYITNNWFYRNIGTLNTSSITSTVIAPGPHEGLIPGLTSDIQFIKNNTSATDQLSFPKFAQGDVPFSPDETPEFYLNYQCTGAGSSETYKYIQIPICPKVKNFEQEFMSFSIWLNGNSGDLIPVKFVQYFGGGTNSPSVSVPTSIGSSSGFTITSSWAQYSAVFQIPSIAAQTISNCGDDAIFIQIGLPLNVTCNISIDKPCLYLGTLSASGEFDSVDFSTYDQINALTNSPRTGDIKTSLNSFNPYGWVLMNDGTIGNGSSNATTRASLDTFPLYYLIWNSINNTLAPMYNSSGSPQARGSTAYADFAANYQISLTKTLGRVLAGTLPNVGQSPPITLTYTTTFSTSNKIFNLSSGTTAGILTGYPVQLFNSGGALPTGFSTLTTYYIIIQSTNTEFALAATPELAYANTVLTFSADGSGTNTVQVPSWPLGTYTGEELTAITIDQMPSHNHPGSTVDLHTGGSNSTIPESGSGSVAGTQSLNIASEGHGQGHNTLQPTAFLNIFMKL